MKLNRKARRGFTLVELLVVIVIIAALAALTAPMVIRQRKKADQTEAVSNARQLGLALFEFESNYNGFPDASTAPTVTTNTGSSLTFGTSTSNDYFRQLLGAEVCQSEAPFYCKSAFTKKPDNVYNDNTHALAAGEVGFGYITKDDNTAMLSAGNPARPIAVCPLAYPFATGKFDSDVFDSKAVVLRIDNSATSLAVKKADGKVQISDGVDLLKGADATTIWGADFTPVIKNPLPK